MHGRLDACLLCLIQALRLTSYMQVLQLFHLRHLLGGLQGSAYERKGVTCSLKLVSNRPNQLCH
jgi:hypothetical protein